MEYELEKFEQTLEAGLVKICSGEGLLAEILTSPDIEGKWDEYLQDYVADAVQNFNQYPDAALGFAAYLGMAVANRWDREWTRHRTNAYQYYYGDRGFDNMDDHIVNDILHLKSDDASKLARVLTNCTQATLGLIRHEGIEAQTAQGFYILVRCYCVFFRIGESIELTRLKYKKVAQKPRKLFV